MNASWRSIASAIRDSTYTNEIGVCRPTLCPKKVVH